MSSGLDPSATSGSPATGTVVEVGVTVVDGDVEGGVVVERKAVELGAAVVELAAAAVEEVVVVVVVDVEEVVDVVVVVDSVVVVGLVVVVVSAVVEGAADPPLRTVSTSAVRVPATYGYRLSPGHVVLLIVRCPVMVGVVTLVPAGHLFDPSDTKVTSAPGAVETPYRSASHASSCTSDDRDA